MNANLLIHNIPKGLLKWYPFEVGKKALLVTATSSDDFGKEKTSMQKEETEKKKALEETLRECGLEIECLPISALSIGGGKQEQDSYDYIVSVAAPERVQFPERALSVMAELLSPSGKLLLGMNNRLGLRYFCGDRDIYTERSFDGVEDYKRIYVTEKDIFRGRMYDRSQLQKMVIEAGFSTMKFFSVFQDLDNPTFLFAEDYLPNEDLANRIFPTYHYPDTVFLEEERLYQQFMNNGMFHKLANAFLIECSKGARLCDVDQVTSSLERGSKDALFTIIHKNGMVEKRAAYPEGEKRLAELYAHGQELEERGIRVVKAELTGEAYRMPYIREKTGQVYLKQLILQDKDKFLQAADHFRDLILRSSSVVSPDCGDGNGAVLGRAYFDMVPLNSFYIDGEFVFYDQEFCLKNYPANVLLYRMVSSLYAGNVELNKALPMETLLERYQLMQYRAKWQQMETEFLTALLKQRELRGYHERWRRNPTTVNANRQRMNYSETEYQRVFMDIFKNADNRNLVLFGSGAFAKQFVDMYAKEYPIYAIIDNNEEKWGQELKGITIQSPQLLEKEDADGIKVMVCIKNYLSVIKQLRELGIHDYSIFDPGKAYEHGKKAQIADGKENLQTKPKRYHTGYVAGVFDLFHVGHVNLLRRAKEQCDYLIVGVISDETVYRLKERYPVIPSVERAEVLRACKYADQVEVLPTEYAGIRDAYKLFHFDCQFTGDDHGDDEVWLLDKEYLRRQGADIVFFPYTKGTSSTEIRKKMESEKE